MQVDQSGQNANRLGLVAGSRFRRPGRVSHSGQYVVYDVAMNIGQPELSALVLES